jgi:hypothetical protein
MRPSQTIRAYRHGLLLNVDSSGSSRFEAIDLDALRKAFGEDVLVGLLRLFVWADRLQSLTHLAYFTSTQLPETSCAYGRNLLAMVWFVSGSLFEAAEAIDKLEQTGFRGRLADTEPWDDLVAMALRWRTQQLLSKYRNRVGFHVDPSLIRKGLLKACKSGDRVVIMASDDDTAGRTTLRLGLDFLLRGMNLTEPTFSQTLAAIRGDQDIFGDRVQRVFVGLLKSIGAQP